MLAGDHPHPFPGWRQRVLDSVCEVPSSPYHRTNHASADGVLEVEVYNKEKRKADFRVGEESFKTVLETSAKMMGMQTAGNWIVVGKMLRVCSRSEKR